jgi:hypothetical protein
VRDLNVDWPALHSAFQMNMPEVRCFLSLEDGRVLKVPPGDTRLAQVREQTTRYAPVEAIPSRIQYQWLDDFIRQVEDPAVKARMEAAINGKGAFRRFKDILLTQPEERRRWFEFRDARMRERIVEWVAENGVRAINQPPWLGGPGEMESAEAPNDLIALEANEKQYTEALRDYLIAWSEGKTVDALSPLSLEKLAQGIAQNFTIKPR